MLSLSARTLTYVTGVIRRHRTKIGSTWRKLRPGRQALLVLAYPRKGETFTFRAAGFGIGTATAWRYVTEAVALLAARSPKLRRARPQSGGPGNLVTRRVRTGRIQCQRADLRVTGQARVTTNSADRWPDRISMRRQR